MFYRFRCGPIARKVALSLALPAALAFAGCASSSSNTDKQVDLLRIELAKLRSTTAALSERLDAAEMAAGRYRPPPPPPVDKPRLEVVKLSPEEPATPQDFDDDTPRAELRSTPNGGVVEVPASARGTQSPVAEPKKKPSQPKR